MWIFLHKDNSLATGVEQQLCAGHARAGRDIGGVNLVDVSALEQGVLLSVDRLAPIEVRSTG